MALAQRPDRRDILYFLGGGAVFHACDAFFERRQADEIDRVEREAQAVQVSVGVSQAGHNRSSCDINHLRTWKTAQYFLGWSYCCDSPVGHRNRVIRMRNLVRAGHNRTP